MANKEERILILTTKNKNGDCECVTQDGCHVNDSCAICNVGMTRQEAIEVMAKALCKFISQGECKNKCKECDLDEQQKIFEKILPQHITFKEQANVMLNALLEGEKND